MLRRFEWKKLGKVIEFNSQSCGRCGGTGEYHFARGGAATKGVCYKCRGEGRMMADVTRGNVAKFQAFVMASDRRFETALAELHTGKYGKAWKVVERVEAVRPVEVAV